MAVFSINWFVDLKSGGDYLMLNNSCILRKLGKN